MSKKLLDQLFFYITIAMLLIVVCNIVDFTRLQAEETNITERAKRGVVSIYNNVSRSAYKTTGEKIGTGFLVDKKKGIILTNQHIAQQSDINNLSVTFFNGRKLDATFVYSDPLIDFAFIKVSPQEIPTEVLALDFAETQSLPGDQVSMIGSNQALEFSVQTGTIATPYRSVGLFPNQSISISLNAKGGSSGSPVLNSQGAVVGIVFGGNETFCDAIKGDYLKDAVKYIINDEVPPRYEIGGLVDYRPIDDIVKYNNFPKEIATKYHLEYPKALSKALVVTEVYQDSNAYKVLEPGDVIWEINNQQIGPELYQMQKIVNESKGESLRLEVYRRGKLKTLDISAYDASQINVMKRMVSFGGAVFFEADDRIRRLFGVNIGKIMMSNVSRDSCFDKLPYVSCPESYGGKCRMFHVISINGSPVRTLDDIVKMTQDLMRKKYFTIRFKNHYFDYGFDALPILSRRLEQEDINYTGFEELPSLFVFNDSKKKWYKNSVFSKKSDKKKKLKQ